MLELIKDELIQSGADEARFLSYNFESMLNAPLCTAEALYQNILEKVGESQGKINLFFDEIQEVENWEKCVNSLRVDLDCDIYITGSNAKLLSGEMWIFWNESSHILPETSERPFLHHRSVNFSRVKDVLLP